VGEGKDWVLLIQEESLTVVLASKEVWGFFGDLGVLGSVDCVGLSGLAVILIFHWPVDGSEDMGGA
jgi:hypothetical protein